jgi:hypothetical protein
MAQSRARIGAERDLAALASGLYRIIPGELAETQRRAAERALLRENPQLARPEGFREDAVIVVPRVAGLDPTARVTDAAAGIDGALDEAVVRLKVASRAIDEDFRKEDARRKAALAQTQDQGFRERAREALPGSIELIDRAARSLREEESASRGREQALKAAVDGAISEIERLTASIRRPTGAADG